MSFTLAVATERGEVLKFDCYGTNERLTALAAARDQSAKDHTPWAEVWEDGNFIVRYIRGCPAPGSSQAVWHDNHLAVTLHGNATASYAREALNSSFRRLSCYAEDEDEDWERDEREWSRR